MAGEYWRETMNQPLISIITPTLNRAEMLAQAIESVLAQNYDNFEHIIIDGGSTDGTLKMLAKYPHLHVISGKDRGMYDAINHGLEVATGEIICFLNSDDLLPPAVLPIVVSALETQPHVDAVVGKAVVFFDAPEQPNTVLSLDFQNELLLQVTRGTGPIFNAWFFRRPVFEKLGNLDIHYRVAGDREFLIRFLLNGLTVVDIPQIVYAYRQHSQSITFTKNRNKIFAPGNEHLMLINAYFKENKIPRQHRLLFREWGVEQSLELTIESIRQNKVSSFFRYLLAGTRYHFLFPLKIFMRAWKSVFRNLMD
ncbi:MAG: hypothetical protein C0410_14170 [Anaerolinea sp.]|nr:hypothetical protein [Anaerolinea sp.]